MPKATTTHAELRPLAHVGVSSFLGISAERCWSGAVGTNLGKEDN